MTRLVAPLVGAVDPGDARRGAREILSGRRFRPERVPRPFAGVLRWIGDRLAPVTRFLGDVLRPIGDFLTSGTGLVLLGILLAAGIGFVAWKLARRRIATTSESAHHLDDLALNGLDPEELEREADAAERAGDLGLALRLRFRAGLLRLDEAGAISFRPSLTSGQVARRLRVATFDDLARTFDAVAYGERGATPLELDAARTGWARVLTEVGTR